MISDEAVEAGIWTYMRSMIQGYDRSFQAPPRSCEREAMRAALEAVLPHLLASQGCGTGHSADAGPCPRSPDLVAALNAAKRFGLLRKQAGSTVCPGSDMPNVGWWPRSPYFDWKVADDLGGPWPVETIARLCQLGLMTILQDDSGKARLTKAGLALVKPPKKRRDGGEAVHSPDEREGSRDKPKNHLAHPQKGGEG